jgi:hypothetical protein
VLGKIFNIINATWDSRNRWLFHKEASDTPEILAHASSMLIYIETETHGDLHSVQSSSANIRNDEASMHVFVDADLISGEGSVQGYVMISPKGLFLLAESRKLPEMMEARIVEAQTIEWAVETVKLLGFPSAALYTYCLSAVQSWQGQHRGTSYFEELIQDCIVFVRALDGFRINFISRELNKCANCNANFAYANEDSL